MGVLWCARFGCENIMCDRYSYKYGYICERCFKELVNSGPETDVFKFMETPPESGVIATENPYEKFNEVFPKDD